jgi:hypothetical protein
MDKTVKQKPIPVKDEIRRVATNALLAVAGDTKAPSAARAAAARTLLESLGDIGRLQEIARANERPLTELSLAELDQMIDNQQKSS